MKKLLLAAVPVGAAAIVAVFMLAGAGTASRNNDGIIRAAAEGKLRPAHIKGTIKRDGKTVTVSKTLPFPSDASVVAAQVSLDPLSDERGQGADVGGFDPGVDGGNGGSTTGSGPAHSLGCGSRDSSGNTRVNQDCSYRRQAEEAITYNPVDPNNLAAGQNDSRVGFNQCGIDFSTTNGKNWGDMLPPFRSHVNTPEFDGPNTIAGDPGSFHTYDAASDPVTAFDSQGRAFFSCVVFDVFASFASGLFVAESPKGAQGSFYYTIPTAGRPFMVVEDNSPLIMHDKNWIAADRYKSSPNRDNVYVTWTVFKFDDSCVSGDNPSGYCSSAIYGSMSTDHARTWSAPQEISGASSLCSFGDAFDPARAPNACDFDQGSSPVVMPNGNLVVAFSNENTPAGNPNGQELGVLCHPAGDSVAGTANLNCAPPTKVGDDVTTGEPLCDFGRGPEQCIPGANIRTNDFPRILTENTQNGHVYAVWQDYRNGEYDIQMSRSLDGGATWHEVGTVNPDRGLDHYFPAVDQSPDKSDRVGVSYYRTERVPSEADPANCIFALSDPATCTPFGSQPGVGTSNSDYALAGGSGDQTPYAFKVVSPVFPAPDGIQAGFNGDYSGLTINRGEDAHPIWSDTRNVDPFAPTNGVTHDEDVFTDNVGLPNGQGRTGSGTIGRR